MTLEIIDHAHCPVESPFYAKLLKLKLESLRRHPVGYPVRYTVFMTPGQELIMRVWREFLDGPEPDTRIDWTVGASKAGTMKGAEYVSLLIVCQGLERFFQRAIGRHAAALSCPRPGRRAGSPSRRPRAARAASLPPPPRRGRA